MALPSRLNRFEMWANQAYETDDRREGREPDEALERERTGSLGCKAATCPQNRGRGRRGAGTEARGGGWEHPGALRLLPPSR